MFESTPQQCSYSNMAFLLFQQIFLVYLLRLIPILSHNKMSSLAQQLPKLTLAGLYSQSIKKQQMRDSPSEGSPSHSHHHDIKVTSAFYKKIQQHGSKCECAYHRMKRYRERAQPIRQEPNPRVREVLEQYKSRVAQAAKLCTEVSQTQRNEVSRSGRAHRQERMTQSHYYLRAGTDLSPDTLKRKQRYSIDNENLIFEQILRKRIEGLQDHEKVSALIKFIKAKSSVDKKYQHKFRDLIYLNLSRVSAKIQFNTIIGMKNEGSAEKVSQIKVIAKLLNCDEEQAWNFVAAIQKSYEDMRGYLLMLARKQYTEENPTAARKPGKSKFETKTSQKLDFSLQSSPRESKTEIHSQIMIQDALQASQQASQKTFLRESHATNKSITSSGKKIHSRKTITTLKQFDKENEKDINGGADLRQSMNSLRQSRNRSLLSKKQSRISELQKEEDEGEEHRILERSRKKQNRHKQSNIYHRLKPDPFKGIRYEEMFSRDQFEKMVVIIRSKPDENVEQLRMQQVFNYIERKISRSPEFFDSFVAEFAKVLTPEQIALLRQKHEHFIYDRMLARLTRQVDNCLIVLQSIEEQTWRYDDSEDLLRNQSACRVEKVEQLSLEYVGPEQDRLGEQFRKFKVIEQPFLELNREENRVFEQKSLKQIKIIPLKSQQNANKLQQQKKQTNQLKTQYINFFPNKKSKVQPPELSPQINKQQHKKILKFMKTKFPNTFSQIHNDITATLSPSKH